MALRRALLVLASVSAMLAAPGGAAAATPEDCTKVASPGDGTAQRLIDSLGPGDVGCLHGGRYTGNVKLDRPGGGESSRIVLRSYPGERAEIFGRMQVSPRADFVTVEDLKLNGRPAPACSPGATCTILPSPTVNGSDVVFQDNEITNEDTAICFNVGSEFAARVVLRRNRIHNCGRRDPITNHDHGIYLGNTEDVQILDNVIYDNSDRGVQFYPEAVRTIVRGNVIDNNGQGVSFGGLGDSASRDNVVENNVITNARLRYNIESWFPGAVGTGNVARNNCVFGGRQGNISSQYGFTASRNLTADPEYVDRGAKDFRLRAGSPCAELLAGRELPAAPGDDNTIRPPVTPAPTAPSGDDAGAGTTEGKPGLVRLENVSLKRSRKLGRGWRLRVAGHVSGDADELLVQVRRGGRWRTLAIARDVGPSFRLVVNPGLSVTGIRSAARMKVRVVIPGVAASNSVRPRTAR
jgi:hypothetical protein